MSDHLNLILVTGAGGFIGGNLVAGLRARGYERIRAVDVRPIDEWYQRLEDVENLSLDLNLKENCEKAAQGASEIYNLAANMGGWVSSSITRRFACFRSLSIHTCCRQW